MRCLVCVVLTAALAAGLVLNVFGQAPQVSKEDAEIVKALEKLASAFNSRDAKAVAAVWSEKGEYVASDTGERLEGRKAIEADFAATFAKSPKEARLELDIGKIRRVGNDVVSVEGTARVMRPKEPVERSQFLAILVRQAGGWLIDSIRETSLPEPETNAAFLESLAWFDGKWRYKDEVTEVTFDCDDVANGNFRSHKFQVKSQGEVIHEGTQIIGWDAAKKQLRSWVFASDGSFGDGFIDQKDKTWTIRVSGTLPSGEKSSATQIFTRKNDNSFTFEVIDRHVGTRVLPNVPEITLTRFDAGAKKGE